MFEKVLKAIADHPMIIIHRHTNPDGDALGSQIGLKHIILANFPDKTVYMVGDAAGRYEFMADSTMDEVSDDAYEGALAIILDTSARKLISDDRYTRAAMTVRMDHHLFCEKIAEEEVVDSTWESCCGLITHFCMSCGLTLPPLAAEALYTGMVTDSGRFRYDAVSANTFRAAAFLMQHPIDTNELYRNLYASDFDQMKLRAQFVLKIQFTKRNVAYIYTPLAEVKACGADLFAISRGMVSTMADIKGVDIWVNFTETEHGVLCELRSSRFNINPVAVKYGGGGHAKASGATVSGREEAMAMLADLDRMMEDAQ
ncbi:MAG: bifunctional oligoribonuclease/PAP phosphatase NrnA [Clostridia bacterium]|nr:bifunctional oligoribonuclease/PAP phosphatase NrnA [Clostridia bacterium]